MITIAVRNWLILISGFFGMVNLQVPLPYPVPYPGFVQMVPGPPQPVPVPVAMPVPVGVPIPYEISTPSTTTTTTCRTPHGNGAVDAEQPTIKIYVPWPPWSNIPLFPNISMPIPFHNQSFTFNIPPQLPYRVVPPVPIMPMPYPVPHPPPLVMIPIPPMIKIKPRDRYNKKSRQSSEESDSSSSDSDDSDDSESSVSSSGENKKYKKKNKYGIYRSNRRQNHESTDEEIKPILTFESKNGDIRLQKRLSMKEAATLMENTNKAEKKVKLTVGQDSRGKSKVSIEAKDGKLSKSHRRSEQEAKNISKFSIGNGHKELVFKVPNNKTIGNLTVSFDIKN